MVGGRSVWWYRSGRLRGHGYLSPVHRRPAVAVSLEGRVRGFQGCGGGQARAAHCNRFRGGLALLLSRARGEDGSRPVGEAGRRVHAPVRGVGGGDGELVKKTGDAAPTSHAPSNRAAPTPGSRRSTTGSRSPSAWPTASTASPTSSPDHAPMQRTRHPTTTTHNLTHKNSRSLSSIQLFVRTPTRF